MKKALFVIDAQYDFLDGGKLGVDGSIDIMDNLVKYVEEHGKDYVVAIATADWHPITHCSFNTNGGQWNPHCIQFSHGASIYEPLLMALNEHTNHFDIFTKGTDEDHEEYSVFKNNKSSALVEMMERLEIEEIDVCGVALSYCVKDTMMDGKRFLPNVKFRLLKGFTPDIGDSTNALKEMEQNNFEII